MHYTIDLLLKGDKALLTHYRSAKARWKEILAKPQAKKVDDLADLLTHEQMWFEHNCGGRWVGQEIMVVVGIAQFYSLDIGFDDSLEDALRVHEAFRRSYCSIEVKGHAKRVADDYHLLDYANGR